MMKNLLVRSVSFWDRYDCTSGYYLYRANYENSAFQNLFNNFYRGRFLPGLNFT